MEHLEPLEKKEVTLPWRLVKHDQGKEEHAPIHISVIKNTDVSLLYAYAHVRHYILVSSI